MANLLRICLRTTTRIVTCTATAILAAPLCASAEPYEIKASWEHNKTQLVPVGVDFYFQGLSNTHGHGIVVLADNLLLRIEDDQPFVTLGIRTSKFETAPSFHDAVSLPEGEMLLSTPVPVSPGTADPTPSRGYLAKRSDGGKFESFPMPPKRDPEHPWGLPNLANGPDGSVWALTNSETASSLEDPNLAPGQKTPEAGLFELANGRWKDVPLPYVGAPYLVSDFCVVAPGDLWIVGSKLSIREDGTITDRSGFAANRSAGDWALFTVPAPEGEPLAWNLYRLACRPGSPVYALGRATHDPQDVSKDVFEGRDVVYATDGTRWHQQPTPKLIAESGEDDREKRLRIAGSAVDTNGRLWVSISQLNGDRGVFASLESGSWSEHELPSVPTVDFYVPFRLEFDAEGTGWATSNRSGNATTPESHGILLRYEEETWKLQGWKWNRLRQRGFGLLGGNLR